MFIYACLIFSNMTNIYFLSIVALLLLKNSEAITFTGNAANDFTSGLTTLELQQYFFNSETSQVAAPTGVSIRSGMDIDVIHGIYDADEDTLYIGVQCAGICGDADGDGNAPFDMCNAEYMAFAIWTNPDPRWDPINQIQGFYPSIIFGDSLSTCLANFAVYRYPVSCPFDKYLEYYDAPFDPNIDPCVQEVITTSESLGTDNFPTQKVETWNVSFFFFLN